MIVVTSHATVGQNGCLNMECGPASEARERIPGIERQCGQAVLAHAVSGVYGFLPVRPFRPQAKTVGFGLFQTRREWDEPADPELIRHSMECLRQYLAQYPNLKVRMDYPGIGNGDLGVEEVAPLLEPLPPKVILCHRGEARVQAPPGISGAKELFLLVERWLQEGRFSYAVEYLMENGYDRQSAVEQVSAVQRLMREQAEAYASRNQKNWEQTHLWQTR